MKTHFIKIYAGIGNQLFQYAHGLYLIQQGVRVRFILNRNFAQKPFFDLPEVFNIDHNLFTIPRSKLSLFISKFYARFINRNWDTGYYQEYRFPQAVDISCFAFAHEQTLSQASYTSQIKSCESISIHIRGGDYLRTQEYSEYGNICTKEYYEKAITALKDIYDKPVFFVFTNDALYAQNMLSGMDEKFVFITGTNVEMDLYLQSICKSNIIANSTFSWWAAYLNRNKDKIVITPSKWHNERPEVINQLVPENCGWRKI